MTFRRSTNLLASIQDELAQLKEQVDLIERECIAREKAGPRCSSAMGYICTTRVGYESPNVGTATSTASSRKTSPWHPAANRVCVASKSRIPKFSQPIRPSSAADVAPPGNFTRFKPSTRAINNSGRSMLPLPKPSGRRNMNDPRSLHSSVSSLMSVGSGNAPCEQKKTRHGSLFSGQDDDHLRSSAKGQYTMEHSVSSTKIPRFAQVRPTSAMGYANVPKNGKDSHCRTSSHGRRSSFGQVICNVSLPPNKHVRNPRSRAISPCLQTSLAKFDVGFL